MSKRTILIVVALCLTTVEAQAATIYVSGSGSDSNDGSTPLKALRNLQTASDKAQAGDVVSVDNGTYAAFTVKVSGTANAWIHFVASAGAKPKIQFDGWGGITLDNAHYVEIRGFEVVGAIAERTLAQCTTDADAANPDPVCNGNCISADGRATATPPSHLLIAGNDIHDCSGAGIATLQADYITVEDNFVHDTSWYTRYATSGISFLDAVNSDSATGYKMIIRRNRTIGNKTLVKWDQIQKLSDGNGIIIDTSKNTGVKGPTGVALTPYAGRFLVENNLSVGNGGSGIHSYASQHVDILYNTAYQNGQVVGYADIYAANSDDVNIVNNIMYARAAGSVNIKDSTSTAILYDYNVYFGGTVASQGPHDVVADPQFIAAALDPTTSNFRLSATSPAIDSATTTFTVADDLDQHVRPAGAGPDRGAYEYAAVAAADGGASDDGGAVTDGGASGDGGASASVSPSDGGAPTGATTPPPRHHGCSFGGAGDPTAAACWLALGLALLALRRRQRD